jgi:hypothetical protein
VIDKVKLKRFAELKAEKDRLDAEVSVIKSEMSEINKEITEAFINDECQNMTLPGLGQFYLFQQEIPTIEDEVLCKGWIADKGDTDLVMSFNSSKFRAYYKSLVEAGEDTPPGTSVFHKQEVRMKKA